MNRITKNIVSFTIIFILLSSLFWTANYIKENNTIERNRSHERFKEFKEKSNDNVEDTNKKEIPTMPEGEQDNHTKPDMPNHLKERGPINREIPQNSTMLIYNILFGIECFLLASMIMYLIMSRFNKKTLKETLSSRDKVIIYILSLLLIGSITSYGGHYIIVHYL